MSTPRRKRLKRAGRLQAAPAWIASYTGKNLVKGYANWFGTNKLTAIKELRMIGVEVSEAYELQLTQSIEQRKKVAAQKLEDAKIQEYLEQIADLADQLNVSIECAIHLHSSCF